MSMRSNARCAARSRPSSASSATPSRRTRSNILRAARSRFGLALRVFCRCFGVPILRWTRFICINESLTLDSPAKLDSNRCDSEVTWGSSGQSAIDFRGAKGMARAHAATGACVQSDSIKGLAQSIAKPAYHRLLIAEPALRRAVPTLIIAFLITICLGAFVQVVDQNRQKRASVKRDLAAVAALLAERLHRITTVRQDRATSVERLPDLLPGLI